MDVLRGAAVTGGLFPELISCAIIRELGAPVNKYIKDNRIKGI